MKLYLHAEGRGWCLGRRIRTDPRDRGGAIALAALALGGAVSNSMNRATNCITTPVRLLVNIAEHGGRPVSTPARLMLHYPISLKHRRAQSRGEFCRNVT